MSFRESRRPSNDNERDRFAGFRVYVGDIGQRMNRNDLEREFGQYGPVTDVWMGRRREPQQQNYAFVVYRYPEDADEAVRDRNGRKVLGRKVRVEHAKPVNSNPRRQRGGWNGDGGGGGGRGGNRGNYYSQRRDMPQRRSRERNYSRKSSSQSPVRNARPQLSPSTNRGRNESYSNSPPKKITKRSHSSSESPERRPEKSKKSKRQVSSSPSPPPTSRSNQHMQDSDSGSLSPSPPPQKKKKKKKQRAKSPESPDVSREYDARQYQKQQDKYREYRDAGKTKSAKGKKKEAYSQNDYSSDDN